MGIFGRRETAVGAKVSAVAVLCDAYISFNDDQAIRVWATKILRSKWPGIEVAANVQVEAAMGFRGGEDEALAEVERLLRQAMATAGAPGRTHFEVLDPVFTARSDMPPSKVWCAAAMLVPDGSGKAASRPEGRVEKMSETKTTPGAPPQFSPDGKWWWDGTHWVPAAEAPGAAAPAPATATATTEPADKAKATTALRDVYMRYLQEHGYQPEVDPDGDVKFKKEGGTYFILMRDDPQCFSLLFPSLWSIDSEAERIKAVAAADAATSRVKAVKVHVSPDGKRVNAYIEDFMPHPDEIEPIFERLVAAIRTGVGIFVEEMRK